MLDYQWANSSPMLNSGDDSTPVSDQSRPIFSHYNQTIAENFLSPPSSFSFQQNQNHLNTLYDSQAFSMSYPHPLSPETVSNGYMVLPKNESSEHLDFPAKIGLNLGGRTYFSSEDDIMNRLYRRSKPVDSSPSNSPKCQAEGCNADLTYAKHYHRRHKVCEFHSKASTVIAGGMTQRFCQQCSRFHLLLEFDHGKRSCRKRLADHNRRRRKSQHQLTQTQPQSQKQSHHESTQCSPSETLANSSRGSVVHSSSPVVSPPRMSLNSYRYRYEDLESSSASLFSELGNFRPYGRNQSSNWDEDQEDRGQKKRGSEFKK
ncbi:hypothetical protein NE237_013396 [Protea cynaroides]|uniref:SBP-type domain-containing protein n=1 Tax=Protea cynaroides TaxID=273540 RepID=A0A9Q0K053_9MAGN|nr:hypothetical protein NE237_013396 [Protea cynaroides]